jgi:putative membrane protein
VQSDRETGGDHKGFSTMRSSPRALAAVLVALGVPAWAQVGDGPVAPMTAPPGAYSSAPASVAITAPRPAPRPPTFAAGSVPGATPMTLDAREERVFLRNAAAQSKFELDASRLAFAKAGNGPVRALAASLINHNNTISLELAHMLSSRGMAMPMISNEHRKTLNQLARASGSRFDAIYMQQVGLAQAGVARDYEKASASIREPQLNAWIVKTLGTTRFHQNMAERAGPHDPQQAKWNRAVKPQAKTPLPGVQPVAAVAGRRLNASNIP